MKHLDQSLYTLLLAIALVTFPAVLNAEELINHSSSVFKFQQRLAENGNVQAQYKLALMYEKGEGAEASFDKALHWYDRAAKSGLKKADQRSTYLMVKELGFNKKIHTDWLNSVKAGANNHEPEAMLLLGQLYRQGIGVTKNLNKSLGLLTQVSVLGDADVEMEIESIHAEIAAANHDKQVAAKSKLVKPVEKKSKAVAKTQKATLKKKQTSATVTAKVTKQTIEKQKLAEKVRRYEKAMQQLKLEQQIIDQQQADVTGGSVASMDDEF